MNHVYYCLIFLFLFLFLYILNNKFKSNEKAEIIKNYDSYLAILSYHEEKAFEIIYKEKIMIYSLESTKLNEEQFRSASKDFGILVLKMIGPSLKNTFTKIYGAEETFLFNLMEYFNTKFENDEIYKNSSYDLINGEDNKI